MRVFKVLLPKLMAVQQRKSLFQESPAPVIKEALHNNKHTIFLMAKQAPPLWIEAYKMM